VREASREENDRTQKKAKGTQHLLKGRQKREKRKKIRDGERRSASLRVAASQESRVEARKRRGETETRRGEAQACGHTTNTLPQKKKSDLIVCVCVLFNWNGCLGVSISVFPFCFFCLLPFVFQKRKDREGENQPRHTAASYAQLPADVGDDDCQAAQNARGYGDRESERGGEKRKARDEWGGKVAVAVQREQGRRRFDSANKATETALQLTTVLIRLPAFTNFFSSLMDPDIGRRKSACF
jgi:hypothetical protein